MPVAPARSMLSSGLSFLVALYRADTELLALLNNRAAVYSQVPQGLAPPYIQLISSSEFPFSQMGGTFGSLATFIVRPTVDLPGLALLASLTSRIRELTHYRSDVLPGLAGRAFVLDVESSLEPIATTIGAKNYWQQPTQVRMRGYVV